MINTKIIDTIDDIQSICGLEILQKTRKRNYIDARASLYCILKKRYNFNDQFIADELAKIGFKVDRVTIWHHINNYDTYYNFSPLFKEIIQVMKGEKVQYFNDFRDRTDLEVFLTKIDPALHDKVFEEVEDAINRLKSSTNKLKTKFYE